MWNGSRAPFPSRAVAPVRHASRESAPSRESSAARIAMVRREMAGIPPPGRSLPSLPEPQAASTRDVRRGGRAFPTGSFEPWTEMTGGHAIAVVAERAGRLRTERCSPTRIVDVAMEHAVDRRASCPHRVRRGSISSDMKTLSIELPLVRDGVHRRPRRRDAGVGASSWSAPREVVRDRSPGPPRPSGADAGDRRVRPARRRRHGQGGGPRRPRRGWSGGRRPKDPHRSSAAPELGHRGSRLRSVLRPHIVFGLDVANDRHALGSGPTVVPVDPAEDADADKVAWTARRQGVRGGLRHGQADLRQSRLTERADPSAPSTLPTKGAAHWQS